MLPNARRPLRPFAAPALAVAFVVVALASAVAACGSSSSGSGTTIDAGGDRANPTDAGADAVEAAGDARSDVAADAAGDVTVVDARADREAEGGSATDATDDGPVRDDGGSSDAGVDGASGSDAGGACVLQVAVGGTNTCAVRTDHTLWCWGKNADGQLGDGTMTTHLSPLQVTALGDQVAAVTMGEDTHACAALVDGTVRCWGNNDFGTLGDGTMNTSPTPVTVTGLADVVQIRGADTFNCARKSDATIWCWGDNADGQLGDGTTTARPSPVQVTALGTSAVQMDVGWLHVCVLKGDGTVWCWGDNGAGALGDGTFMNQPTPVQATGLQDVTTIGVGAYHSCARRSDGSLSCWGYNHDGQLNDGTMTSQGSPVAIGAVGMAVLDTDEGFSASFARETDKTVWYWGYGVLTGITEVPGLTADVLVAGDDHECAIDTSGVLQCWGINDDGELGDGTTTGRDTPAPVALPCP